MEDKCQNNLTVKTVLITFLENVFGEKIFCHNLFIVKYVQ